MFVTRFAAALAPWVCRTLPGPLALSEHRCAFLTPHPRTSQLEGLVESLQEQMRSVEAALGERIRELEGRVGR